MRNKHEKGKGEMRNKKIKYQRIDCEVIVTLGGES